MNGGVGAPRSPRFGDPHDRSGRRHSRAVGERAPQTEIREGKGIRIAEGTQRDVLGRPCADSGKRREPLDSIFESLRSVERQGPPGNGARKGPVKFWSFPPPQKMEHEAQLVPQIRATLDEAVRDHLVALLNRRNYIRNLVRGIGEVLEGGPEGAGNL